MQIDLFLLRGWILDHCLLAFSMPALTVAVSTCLEPRGGLLTPLLFYQKAALKVRGLSLICLVKKLVAFEALAGAAQRLRQTKILHLGDL